MALPPIQFTVVDAFASKAFEGNPAAVCLMPKNSGASDELLQKIAREQNLSETAFVSVAEDGDFATADSFSLRWFTPSTEVALCGHATLATAAVIAKVCKNMNPEFKFMTKSGTLSALNNVMKTGANNFTINLPDNAGNKQSNDVFANLASAALGELSSSVKEFYYSPSTAKLVIRMPDEFSRGELESLQVNSTSLLNVDQSSTSFPVRGLIITVIGGSGNDYDFLSRYFAPWVGINEDPVTGSAHTVLAPYWSKELGRRRMKARQCSTRGGDIDVELRSDNSRVLLTGGAVIVAMGDMYV